MKIAIVGMIYRSTAYLDFMLRGMLATPSWSCWEVQPFIVANDATDRVRMQLRTGSCQWLDYRDPKPSDYYLNRVYRAWNAGGKAACAASADVICFVNSDMWPAKGWLKNLVDRLDNATIPCSRLIESGKMPSGLHGISRDFGRSPQAFRQADFDGFAASVSRPSIAAGGLFMPCCFYRKQFLESGGYPEGNVYAGGVGRNDTKFVESGDHHFFYKNPVMREMKHVTVFDSLVYHAQEGEKDEGSDEGDE